MKKIKQFLNNHSILFVKIPEICRYNELNQKYSSSLNNQASIKNEISSTFQSKIESGLLNYFQNSSFTYDQKESNISTSSYEIFNHLSDLKFFRKYDATNENSGNNYHITQFDKRFWDQHENESNSSMEQILSRNEYLENWNLFIPFLGLYLKRYLKTFSVRGTTMLCKFHEYCLSKFINFAFEMVI